MKKFLYIIIGIFIGWIIFAQTNAISNWTQTLFGENWGIYSPTKSNTTTTPSFVITPDAKVGVWLANAENLKHTNMKAWYIMAQGYCFEKSKECVTSFEQSLSNTINFNPVIESKLNPKDAKWEPYVPELWKTFFIDMNSDFINNVWMDPNYGTGEFIGQQATNWFNIWYSYFNAFSTLPKSLFVEEWDNLSPAILAKKWEWNFVETPEKNLIYCRIRQENWIIRNFFDKNRCKNDNQVINYYYCDNNSRWCGYPKLEIKLTMWNSTTAEKCDQYPQHPILKISSWWSPTTMELKSTSYENNQDPNTPTICKQYQIIHSRLQARLIIEDHNLNPAQSLVELAKTNKLKIWIWRMWLNLLQ